ncbi:MAG: tetratricopeptide repeat protein [Planctomycetota bacterium]
MGNKLFCFLVSLILILVYSIYAENTPTKDIPQQSPEQDPKEKAIQQYRLTLKENPNDIETHRAYQNLMRQCGGLNNLKGEYIVKLNAEPQNSLYHYLYGRLLDGKELEDAFKKAMELETKSPNQELRFWINSGLGQFYKDTKKYTEAIQNLETAQKLKPDFLDVRHQMALIYYETNNITEALNIWDKLLKIKPDYLDARLGKSVAYKSQGKYDEAIKELETILKIDEQYLKTYEPLIQCYHAKQDYKKGEELRTKIKELYQKTNGKEFGYLELIVIDIINLKQGILIVKERISPKYYENYPLTIRTAYADYYFKIYKEGIDKKPGVVYELSRVCKFPDMSLVSVRLAKTEVIKKDTKPEWEFIREYKTIPAYLELLTLIMNREKDK